MARMQFTVGEIERLIPKLEKIFTQVLQLRAAMHGEKQKLDRAGVRLSRESLQSENARDTPVVRSARAMYRALHETVADRLREVEAVGGQIKDAEQGLVDFPALRGEQEISLCWKFGERSVNFWHPADQGFSARRPIDEQVPREPPPLD